MIIRKAFKFRLKTKPQIESKLSRFAGCCPLCQHTEANNRKTQAAFACLKCGYKDNTDHAAAINILAAGQAVSACGDIGPVAVQAQESFLL
jgi:transposase